jgi:DNA-binding cell septation regulator SpoVG
MKLTACILTLKEKMPDAPELPAWLRAKAAITLDNQVTLQVTLRDSVSSHEVFITYPKTPEQLDQFSVAPELRKEIEPQILWAYQKAEYPWLANAPGQEQPPAPLHPLTLEILDGLREYYDYAVDLYLGQRKVNDKVIKLLGKKTDWDQNDYEDIKSKVEPILQKIQDTLTEEQNEEGEVP